jgi:hypothetical protein
MQRKRRFALVKPERKPGRRLLRKNMARFIIFRNLVGICGV